MGSVPVLLPPRLPRPAHLEGPSHQAPPFLHALQQRRGLRSSPQAQDSLAFLQGDPWGLQREGDMDVVFITHSRAGADVKGPPLSAELTHLSPRGHFEGNLSRAALA